MDEKSLVQKFRDADLCLTPGALEFLLRMKDKEVEELLEILRKTCDAPFVTLEVLRKALNLEKVIGVLEAESAKTTRCGICFRLLEREFDFWWNQPDCFALICKRCFRKLREQGEEVFGYRRKEPRRF